MKLLKFTIAALFMLLVATSCKNENKELTSEKSPMQQVLAVHDEVMPKMGTLGRLISQINTKMKATDSTEALVNASQDLKNANKAMMDWMENFGNSFDSDEILKGKALTYEKQKILDEEEAKIKALRNRMNETITHAEKLLE